MFIAFREEEYKGFKNQNGRKTNGDRKSGTERDGVCIRKLAGFGGTGEITPAEGGKKRDWEERRVLSKKINLHVGRYSDWRPLYCQPGWSWLDGDPMKGIEGNWMDGTPFEIKFSNDATYDPELTTSCMPCGSGQNRRDLP